MFCGLSKSSFLMAALLVCGASPALDAAGVVTNCNSSGPGSLTATISGGGLVTFAISCPSTSPIAITATLSIVANTTIDATGYNVALDGGMSNTVLAVNSNVTLALNNLTIQNGASGASGGGIYNPAGTLTVTNSTFSGNTANRTGGAILNGGTALITNSTFFENTCNGAGGAINNDGAVLVVTNSTFVQNSASKGGAVFDSGVAATITSSTFLDNTAPTGSALGATSATTTLQNNILEGGHGLCDGSPSDGGYNLSTDFSCGFGATGSQNGVSASSLGLASMPASNGGPTQTIALAASSVAVGAIPAGKSGCATGIAIDQRGVARPGSLNGNCSIGAYEYVVPVTTTITNCSNDTQLQSAVTTGGRIVFACSGDIVLTGTLNVSTNTALDATGQIVALDGGGSNRVLANTQSGAALVINNLAVLNGSAPTGAGITTDQLLVVTNSNFSGNQATASGGAILTDSTTVILNSTFSKNTGPDGSAIFAPTNAELDVVNSTFASNTGGAAIDSGFAFIGSSTFSGNTSGVTGSPATIENTILVGSTSGECGGVALAEGYDVIDDLTCGAGFINSNATLGTLGYNGGPTLTIPLNAGSAAVGAIPLGSNGCGATGFKLINLTDERGVFRPQVGSNGPACDIGAIQTAQNQVQMTFETSPSSGPSYFAGPASYTGQQVFTLPADTLTTIWAPSPQSLTGAMYNFSSWSDSGAEAHQITINPGLTSETANFNASYLLTTAANPPAGGSVSISANETGSNGYYPAGTQITLTAHATTGYVFAGWTLTGTPPSSSNPLTFTLNGPVSATANFLRATTTVGSVSQAPVAWGQPMTLFASVSNGTATPPTGTVTFKLGSTTIGSGPLINGAATYNSNGQQLAPGGNHLMAVYSGDSGDAPSTSTNYFEVLVEQATTTTSVSYSPNPAVPYETITFTATVSPQYSGTPTGTVTFYQNGVAQATVALVNGNATYSVRTLNAGTYTIKATYNGSTNFSGSSGTVKATVL